MQTCGGIDLGGIMGVRSRDELHSGCRVTVRLADGSSAGRGRYHAICSTSTLRDHRIGGVKVHPQFWSRKWGGAVMSERLNVYEQWLGIAPGNQPPSYYQLLGLRDFESSPAEIANAANRQFARVEASAGPAQAAAAKALMEQIRMAERCLLTPETKRTYDRHLQVKSVERQAGELPPDPNGNKRTANPIALFSLIAASLAILVFLVGLLISARQQSSALARNAVTHATTTDASQGQRPPAGSPSGEPAGPTAELPANPAHLKEQQPQEAPGSASEGETAHDRETASWPPSWLRLDEHGEPCEATLADGSVLKLDTYGETYLGYDRPPPPLVRDDEVLLDNGIKASSWGSLSLDLQNKTMYFIEAVAHESRIMRANLDGTGLTNLTDWDEAVPILPIPDATHGKLYWYTQSMRNEKKRAIYMANLDGSEPQVIVSKIIGCGALDVDPVGGGLYYFADHRLIRTRLDGSNESQVLARDTRSILVDHVDGKIYLGTDYDGIFRSNLDGSQVQHLYAQFSGWGAITSLAVDHAAGKIYWLDTRRNIRRANLDGSQIEDVVVGISGASMGVDAENGYLYFESGHTVGFPNKHSLIYRRRIPAPPSPSKKAAPPLIERFAPARSRPGEKLTLYGRFFTGAEEVLFVDDATGLATAAEFNVTSDGEISATVPELSERCSQVAVIVRTPSGVTVTLPRNAKAAHSGDHIQADRFRAQEQFAFISEANVGVLNVERAVVLALQGSRVSSDAHGQNVFFIKDGAVTHVRARPDNVVYYEPFAIINWIDEPGDNNRLIPVPAIRPSFFETLPQYQQE